MAVTATRASTWAPFRHRDFRLLWTGLIVSNTGSWMQFVALGYLVDRLTESALYLGVLAAVQAAPRLLFALVGGTAADRVDRRRLLMVTNVFLMGTATILALLTATGRIQIWQIFVLAGLNSMVQSFDMPARHSMVPQLVEEREVLAAVSLNSVAFNGAGIFGPSLGGVIIAAIGEGGCFAVNAASYLAVLAALVQMSVPEHRAAGGVSVLEDVQEGLRLLRAESRLLLFLGSVAALSFFGRPYIRLLPTFAREVLQVGPRSLGLLQSAPGIGTIGSALLVGRLSEMRGKGTLLSVAMVTFGILVAVFGVVDSFWLSLFLLVLIGMAQSLAMSSANTLVQLTTPPHARGRLMGLYSMVAFGGVALGSLPVGAVAGTIGIGLALSAGGIVVVILAVLLTKRLRGIE